MTSSWTESRWRMWGGLVALLVGLPAAGQAGAGHDERLKRELLAEILAEDGASRSAVGDPGRQRIAPEHRAPAAAAGAATDAPAEPDASAELEGRPALSTPRARPAASAQPQVGAAVASVPTWPVMALIVFLAGVLLWLKRSGRLGGQGQAQAIHKLASVPLGGKRSLALVEVLGQKLVLGLSEKGLSLLARIDGQQLEAAEVAAPDARVNQADPFEAELRELLAGEAADADGLPPAAERLDLARKFRHLRQG